MIIYLNGDSYMNFSTGKKTSDFLGEYLKAKSVNKSIPGSSNDRILRTSLRDLINLRKSESGSIIAVIGLSFIYRKSFWDPIAQQEKWKNSDDGEFGSYQLMIGDDWFEKFHSKNKLETNAPNHMNRLIREHVRFFSTEAEFVNLFQQLILFSSWCRENNIQYIIFSGPLQEDKIDIKAPFIEPFYTTTMQDKNILNIFEFSFCNYCFEQGFIGVDYEKLGKNSHQTEEAHASFAKFLIKNFNL